MTMQQPEDAPMAAIPIEIVRRRNNDEFICCLPTQNETSVVWCDLQLSEQALGNSDRQLLADSCVTHMCTAPLPAVAYGLRWVDGIKFHCAGGIRKRGEVLECT